MTLGGTSRREALADRVAERLHWPVTIAGVLLVVVLVVDNLTPRNTALSAALDIAGWALWALFVAEFVARLVIAPSTARFLRRNWWQLVFLAVPFLRFLRALSRGSRVARATSTSVRGTRTAGRRLAGQLGWLGGITIGTILVASELLFTYGGAQYPEALHAVTLSAVSGEPLEQRSALADVLEIVLAIHAVVIFATLAGVLGAFFLDRMRTERAHDRDGDCPGSRHGADAGPSIDLDRPAAAPSEQLERQAAAAEHSDDAHRAGHHDGEPGDAAMDQAPTDRHPASGKVARNGRSSRPVDR